MVAEEVPFDALEQTRFRVAEGFDYARTVNYKLLEVMRFPRGSTERAHAVQDLDDLMWPKRDDAYRGDVERLTKELRPNGEKEIQDYAAYSMGLLRVLLALMERRQLLGGTDVSEDF
jgi:nucleotidyltransferase/DNA polymerase involved in DNA repair